MPPGKVTHGLAGGMVDWVDAGRPMVGDAERTISPELVGHLRGVEGLVADGHHVGRLAPAVEVEDALQFGALERGHRHLDRVFDDPLARRARPRARRSR